MSEVMKPSDFHRPNKHPFGMLTGYGLQHTMECEQFLAGLLIRCQDQNSWEPLQTINNEDHLVEKGLLAKVGDKLYKLTPLALGLLYQHYGKEV